MKKESPTSTSNATVASKVAKKRNNDDTDFIDRAVERNINAGILKHGHDAFIDVSGVIGEDFFSDRINRVIYSCAERFYSEGNDRKLDYVSLMSTAKKLGIDDILKDPDAKRHIRVLYNMPIDLESVQEEAKKLFRYRTAFDFDQELARIRRKLHSLNGTESLSQLITMVEDPIFSLTSKLNTDQDGPIQIAEGGREWLQNIKENPRENIGIPSPWPKYNYVIGGGWRRKTVSMLAARPKTGKTMWADNVCMHVAGELNIPVFNLDTEMTQEEHLARIMAMLTGVHIRNIETGIGITPDQWKLLEEKMDWLGTIPYHYESVIDKTFEQQVSSMRRWVVKNVGIEVSGQTKDCLVVYDYLQMTDPGDFHGDFKEYQMLGFQMMSLLRLAKRCDIPILSLLQTNREGITKETTAVASGSDRIIWKCANFSILKRKDVAEIARDGKDEGNRKIVIPIGRHGEEMEEGDYISMKFDGKTAQMVEGKMRSEILQEKGPDDANKGFEVDQEARFDARGHAGREDTTQEDREETKKRPIHKQPRPARASRNGGTAA